MEGDGEVWSTGKKEVHRILTDGGRAVSRSYQSTCGVG